ncbi:hypothetical protein [Mycolicibacterium palauense]|uniref:hypothetical protein n=1 Tax=Mycolicibacterium palauense TaxID=2034511 RepID=UPI001FE42381|nr:hypothetical protein [Mycolicibacterium palauense]
MTQPNTSTTDEQQITEDQQAEVLDGAPPADTATATEHDQDADTETGGDGDGEDDDPEQFPREYVQQLRKESAGYRERAQRADQLAQRLHSALVAATGRLQDPTDLTFDESHLDDPDKLKAAIDDLVTRKPHLKSRRVIGDVGQGAGGVKAADVNLADMLRSRA